MVEPESPIPREVAVSSALTATDDDARSPETKKKKLKDTDFDESSTSVFQVQDHGHVEVEQVGSDEFEFLNGATRLAILQSGKHLHPVRILTLICLLGG